MKSARPFLQLAIEYLILILLTVFILCLPYFWHQTSYLLGVACGLAVIDRLVFLKFSEFKTIRWQRYAFCFLPMVVLFALDLIGLLYTSVPKAGAFIVEKHLSFFAFPLLFTMLGPDFFSLKRLKALGLTFYTTCLIVVGICLYNIFSAGSFPDLATYKAEGRWLTYLNVFLHYPEAHLNVKFLMHHTFQAWYMLTAMTLITYSWILWPQWYKVWYWKLINLALLLIFFVVGVLFAQSKMGYIVLGVWLVGLFGLLLIKRYYKAFLLGGTVAVGLAVGCLIGMPSIQNRVEMTYQSFVNNVLQDETEKTEVIQDGSVYARLMIWDNAVESIKEKPCFGWGTGGEQDEANLSRPHLQPYRGNTHNEFLAYGIRFGLVGMMLFAGSWVFWFFCAARRCNLLLGAFLFLSFCFMLTDNSLDIQIGITFFCTLFGLILSFPADPIPAAPTDKFPADPIPADPTDRP